MGDLAIRVQSLGKQYRIGAVQRRHDTLRDQVVDGISSRFRRLKNPGRQGPDANLDTIWALKDLSLEIERGEVVGIIGRNGAGKTTLLKILSRITEPTEGRAEIRGRVGSLLEVGTGFHPELTGRENIYLNGAILGMKRSDIDLKFAEMVAFAEIERFLDTPVKRYSSGMYVRLAFAVAAHLEPEVLLVDEVLAVGDIDFQRKCLGKMAEVAREGRTVLFVSHSMDAIQRLCQRGLVLREGSLGYDGPATRACREYVRGVQAHGSVDIDAGASTMGDGRVRITNLEVIDEATGLPITHLPSGRSFKIRFGFVANEPVASPRLGFALLSDTGARVFNSMASDSGLEIERISGAGTAELCVRDISLAPGSYSCHVAVSDRAGNYCDYVQNIPCLEIEHSHLLSKSRSYSQACGVVYVNTNWRIRSAADCSHDGQGENVPL